MDFAPYVEEGLILAHFLVDEPCRPTVGRTGDQPGRHRGDGALLQVDLAHPAHRCAGTTGLAVAGDTTYSDLDIAWAQWAGPERAGGNWRTPEDFRDENVARAKQLGLGRSSGSTI